MSPRDKGIATVVALLLLAVIGYVAIVAPTRSDAGRLSGQIAAAQTQLATAQEQVLASEHEKSQATQYADELASLRTAVPSDAQIPQLIDDLQAAASSHHIGFQAVTLTSGGSATSAASATTATTTATTATTTAAAGFPSQSFNLQFTGRYFTVTALLGTLSRFVVADNRRFAATGRLLTINSVSFGAGPNGFPGVSSTVTISDYDLPSSLSVAGATQTGTVAATNAADVQTR